MLNFAIARLQGQRSNHSAPARRRLADEPMSFRAGQQRSGRAGERASSQPRCTKHGSSMMHMLRPPNVVSLNWADAGGRCGFRYRYLLPNWYLEFAEDHRSTRYLAAAERGIPVCTYLLPCWMQFPPLLCNCIETQWWFRSAGSQRRGIEANLLELLLMRLGLWRLIGVFLVPVGSGGQRTAGEMAVVVEGFPVGYSRDERKSIVLDERNNSVWRQE